MKSKFVLLTVLFSPLFAFAAPNLEGVWRLRDRECVSGARKQDGINLNRDKIFLTLKDKIFRLDFNVLGMKGGVLGTYSQAGNRVEVVPRKNIDATGRETDSKDSPATVYSSINAEGKLVLVTADFKKAGQCPAGDALVLTLVKQ